MTDDAEALIDRLRDTSSNRITAMLTDLGAALLARIVQLEAALSPPHVPEAVRDDVPPKHRRTCYVLGWLVERDGALVFDPCAPGSAARPPEAQRGEDRCEPAPLSAESRAALDRGIADVKAGRVQPFTAPEPEPETEPEAARDVCVPTLTREEAVAYFQAEWARIRENIKSLPRAEQIRFAADIVERGGLDRLAINTLRYCADAIEREQGS